MATKIVTSCDITNQVCHQVFRVGISEGDFQYVLELSEAGMKILLGELIANISPEILNNIMKHLVGAKWKETLSQ